MVTSQDVALAAGVSQPTVSRVLSDSPNVKPETRERVLKALRELNYVPDGLARALVTRKTGTVGVVVEDITNPFYPEVVEALCSELAAVDYRMTLWNSGEAGEPGAIDAIRQRMIDGVIFTTATAESVVLKEAVRQGSPVTLLNRHVEGVDCDRVTADNVGGGKLIAEYLLDHGHERIGLISGLSTASTAVERESGFREGLKNRGVELDEPLRRQGDFSHRRSYEAMTELLQLPLPPTAVFCANDLSAFGALNAARALGMTVPEDVWVIGFDDIEMASWEAFGLTTVRQPIPEMARVAVEMLMQRLADPDQPLMHREFGSELVIRRSTAQTKP